MMVNIVNYGVMHLHCLQLSRETFYHELCLLYRNVEQNIGSSSYLLG
jgi:hypothetical protein